MKKFIFLTFLIICFGFSFYALGFSFGNPIPTIKTVTDLVNEILKFLFNLALVICPIIIVYAGFLYITAAGNPQKIETAQKTLVWALIGLAVVLVASAVPNIIKNVLYGDGIITTPTTID